MEVNICPLESTYRKKDFSCGIDLLDNYIKNQASQDVRRKLCVCFVLLKENLVKGYFTLSNNGIYREDLPDDFIKRLPKSYSNLPTTLLGRLAIDTSIKQQGFGELMLIDALKKSYESSKLIGSIAVIVDPFNEDAKRFYENYGFILIPDSKKMFLPMKTIAQLFK